MNRILFLASLALLTLSQATQAKSKTEQTAPVAVSLEYFYDALTPYGEWNEVEGYNFVWHPGERPDGWAPYTDGYWSFTDAGWTWVSHEEFGGITYHYGRWLLVDDVGWCWHPDTQWGPAWVQWQKSEDNVGWAPLPPERKFEREKGLIFADQEVERVTVGPEHYNFVSAKKFGATRLREALLPREQNVELLQQSEDVTNFGYNEDADVIYDGGPDYTYIAERSESPVPIYKLVRQERNYSTEGSRGALLASSTRGNALYVGAPRFSSNANSARPARVVNTFSAEKVNRGWSGVKEAAVRQQLTARSQPKAVLAPAAVNKTSLAVVPKKVDSTAKPKFVVPKTPKAEVTANTGTKHKSKLPEDPATAAREKAATEKLKQLGEENSHRKTLVAQLRKEQDKARISSKKETPKTANRTPENIEPNNVNHQNTTDSSSSKQSAATMAKRQEIMHKHDASSAQAGAITEAKNRQHEISRQQIANQQRQQQTSQQHYSQQTQRSGNEHVNHQQQAIQQQRMLQAQQQMRMQQAMQQQRQQYNNSQQQSGSNSSKNDDDKKKKKH